MGISLDHLESLWPFYRGAVLAGMARESQGRVTNARVAMTAGHVALSLEVHKQRDAPDGDDSEACSMGAKAATTDADSNHAAQPSEPMESSARDTNPRPALRLTVLLDAVPDNAPKPGVHQMAKFLTKVLAASETGGRRSDVRSSSDDVVVSGAAFPALEESAVGENVPELLVVKHEEEVISSQFIRCGHLHGPNLVAAAEGPVSQAARSPTLIYACIEAGGLLRFWKWESERGGWRWGYLNSCNICAFREDPVGCRVLTAVFSPEPDEKFSRVGRRHRLLWEQEDRGEGAGLGLVFTPTSLGPSLSRRRVWSRRVTFDLDEYDKHVSAEQQQHQLHQGRQRDEDGDGNDGLAGGGDGGRPEIGLAFSACVLPTGVDALLGSRLGAWMAAGKRVFLNDFSTGRLRDTVIPSLDLYLPPLHGQVAGFNGRGSDIEDDVELRCHRESQGGGVPLTGESVLGEESRATKEGIDASGDDADDFGGMAGFASETVVNGEGRVEVGVSPTRRRLFTVLDSTGELVVYDHSGVVRVVSLPSGDGNLDVSLRCTLHPPPPAPPRCLAVHRNTAVLAGGGLCSAYDLSTGHLLGATAIPRCPACALGRPRDAASAAARPGSSCSCGRWRRRRRPMAAGDPNRWSASDHDPTLWVSETGHLMGILTASHVLRIRFPRAEARVEAMLAPSVAGQQAPTAPTVLRHLREYKRTIGGGADDFPPTSLLPELFRYQDLDTGTGHAGMLEILRHALAAEEGGCDTRGRTVPPWLLLALLSASQNGARCFEQASSSPEAGTAAAEEVRDTVERRVAESLRRLERVRALLQDHSGSVRPGSHLGGPSPGNGSPVAREIASPSAAVDPATALFEGTLRKWLGCRRVGQHKGLGIDPDGNREGASTAQGGGRFSDGDSSPALDDVLALAFRCETAGEVDAQETPFLRLVLEDSRQCPGEAPRRDDEKEDERGAREEAAFASSTFLCLHLAGDDSSPLFEVACRALFRLRPRQLPRFVERLSRFRAFADRIGGDDRGTANRVAATASPSSSAASAAAAHIDGTDEAIHPGDEHVSSAKESALRAAEAVGSGDISSADVNAPDTSSVDEGVTEYLNAPLSPMLHLARSLRSSEESTNDGPTQTGEVRSKNLATRSSSAVFRARSPELASLPGAAAAAIPTASIEDASRPPPHRYRDDDGSAWQSTAHSAPAYFARALGCLPPAGEDGMDGSQRRARLSLLMGARMFTEACRLLRARAWEGPGGRWRDDLGAADAWRAAMRLLDALRCEAADEGEREKREDEAVDADASGTDAGGVLFGAAVSPSEVSLGGLSLQFRLVFEDSLTETVLADSPDRMEMVMSCRPSDLAPISVVRMVRRAVAAVATAKAGDPCSGGGQAGVVGEYAGKFCERAVISASAQTLKRCLLLLFEDGYDANQAPVDTA